MLYCSYVLPCLLYASQAVQRRGDERSVSHLTACAVYECKKNLNVKVVCLEGILPSVHTRVARRRLTGQGQVDHNDANVVY